MRRAAFLTIVLAGLAVPTPAAEAGTRWDWPVQPHSVVRGFDPPPADEAWLPGHRGVDLAGQPGMPVRAAGAGVVAFAGRVAGVPVVAVDHPDGLETTYEPVRSVVRAGDRVGTGDVIGRLVADGSHCAPAACLHWGLRRGSDYLDPVALVGAGTVRLLPVPTALLGSLPSGPALVGASSVGLGLVGLGLRRFRAPSASRRGGRPRSRRRRSRPA